MAEASYASLHAALDPKSLILSHLSDPHTPQILRLTMERGPRFKEYSDLREKKLRSKNLITPESEAENISVLTPQKKKQVQFSSNLMTATPPSRRPKLPPSVVAQSVPDFSSAIRKENRRPAVTPPAGVVKGGGGRVSSKSANSGEKKSGGGLLMARKSYANMEELKKLSVAARREINGGGQFGNK